MARSSRDGIFPPPTGLLQLPVTGLPAQLTLNLYLLVALAAVGVVAASALHLPTVGKARTATVVMPRRRPSKSDPSKPLPAPRTTERRPCGFPGRDPTPLGRGRDAPSARGWEGAADTDDEADTTRAPTTGQPLNPSGRRAPSVAQRHVGVPELSRTAGAVAYVVRHPTVGAYRDRSLVRGRRRYRGAGTDFCFVSRCHPVALVHTFPAPGSMRLGLAT